MRSRAWEQNSQSWRHRCCPGIDVGQLLALASLWYRAEACVPGLVRLCQEKPNCFGLEEKCIWGWGEGSVRKVLATQM